MAAIAPGAVARGRIPDFPATLAGAPHSEEAALVATDVQAYLAASQGVAAIKPRERQSQIAVPPRVTAGLGDEASPPAMSQDRVDATPWPAKNWRASMQRGEAVSRFRRHHTGFFAAD